MDKIPGAGPGNRTKVFIKLLLIHPYTGVRDCKDPPFVIKRDVDSGLKRYTLVILISESEKLQLIKRIRGIRDKLPQENLLVGI